MYNACIIYWTSEFSVVQVSSLLDASSTSSQWHPTLWTKKKKWNPPAVPSRPSGPSKTLFTTTVRHPPLQRADHIRTLMPLFLSVTIDAFISEFMDTSVLFYLSTSHSSEL